MWGASNAIEYDEDQEAGQAAPAPKLAAVKIWTMLSQDTVIQAPAFPGENLRAGERS